MDSQCHQVGRRKSRCEDFDILTVDLAYEYSRIKYGDVWQSNANYNTNDTHTVWLETGIRF